MAYSVIQYPAMPTVYTPKVGRRIDMIVMHATGGKKSGDLWTLSGRDATHQVSVHYYVTKLGEVYQLVRDGDIAWHAGDSYWQGEIDCNRFSIGIELENWNDGFDPWPAIQVQTATALVRDKVRQYNIERSRVVRHAQIAQPPGRKTDPRGFPWERFMLDVYLQPAIYTRSYIVKPGAVGIIRSAKWRDSTEVLRLAAGQVFVAQAIVFGETVDGSNEWMHDAMGRGFVHSSALMPV